LLLDTNVLLWWLAGVPQLSASAREQIASGDNTVFVSTASGVEIGIKHSVGKLRVPLELETHIANAGFSTLPVTMRHGLALAELPVHHRDPFDRLLVAQARCEGLTLVTGDKRLAAYDVPILPAVS
jgi:PIN domain nuclease of toxin-antitoxin system